VTTALEGIPETALWTLYHRALASRRHHVDDPRAEALVEQLDYPFEERFGGGELAAWQALRVRAFDREVRRFMHERPGGTVVALGEGLETQLWRVDDGRVKWVSVDLPEAVALRERALPAHPRQTLIAGSALDERWMDAVRGDALITAQGLVMYLEREPVHGLLRAIARRFRATTIVFDVVSKWLSARSGRPGPTGYRPPPWPYGVDRREREALRAIDGIATLERVPLPHGRGLLAGFILPLAGRLPVVSVLRARTAR
jgi:O-methyltransferase involved in polyketide biosynthesis